MKHKKKQTKKRAARVEKNRKRIKSETEREGRWRDERRLYEMLMYKLTHTHRCKVRDPFERKPLLQTHSALTEVCVPHTAELLTHTNAEPLMLWPCRRHTHVYATHSSTARANTLASHPCMHTPSQRATISYSWGSSIQRCLYDNPSSQREAGSGLRVWVSLGSNPVAEPEIFPRLSF